MDQWLGVDRCVGISSVKEDIPVRRHQSLLIPLKSRLYVRALGAFLGLSPRSTGDCQDLDELRDGHQLARFDL